MPIWAFLKIGKKINFGKFKSRGYQGWKRLRLLIKMNFLKSKFKAVVFLTKTAYNAKVSIWGLNHADLKKIHSFFNNKIKFSATLFQAERDIELENCAISEITPSIRI